MTVRWTLCFLCSGVCGQLLLEESGTLDLRHAVGGCIVSIGRPLDEVIHIHVESAALSCQNSTCWSEQLAGLWVHEENYYFHCLSKAALW